MRRLLVCVLALAVLVTGIEAGVAAAAPADRGVEASAAKRKKCKRGYKRKRVRGKVRCVKKKKKAAPAPVPAPQTAPTTRTTDPGAIQQKMAGTLWFWTAFDQAGTGGTTDRTHVNLCADGTFRLRRSSTTEDGQGSSFTVIAEDLAPSWSVVSGFYDSATGDIEATVSATATQRRVRTASGPEFSNPNATYPIKLARIGGNATLDGSPASLLSDPPFCDFE
jgi:hypothetical protein